MVGADQVGADQVALVCTDCQREVYGWDMAADLDEIEAEAEGHTYRVHDGVGS